MTDFPTQGNPPFINRGLSIAEWENYLRTYNFGTVPPTRVVLHHTYIPTVAQWQGLRTLQGIQRYYAGLGWSAGPHIFVGTDAIWLATPMRDVGIHAGTGNSGRINGRFWYSIGVEMVGNYDSVRPSGPIWEQTKAVLGGLSRRLGIPPRQLISFHRDYTNQKSCPGWAVTKDWVFAEVEAWLRGQQPPPPPPPGPIGNPRPETERLLELLLQATFSRRGEGYNDNWAFHQFAVQNNLGAPIGRSARIEVGGKSYSYQAFARETLYNEVPNWGEVQRLSTLIGTTIPASGLGRALLNATYQSGGATLRPDWAFHQFAVANRLGPAIGGSTTITVNGAQYSYQVFALDTLYNQVPNWGDVRRLSGLARATDAAQVRLREALLTQTYRAAGVTYHPEWAFHQLARSWNLGAPLSDSYRISSGTTQYALQVYATDTLYNQVPNWSDVRRLSGLLIRPPAATLLAPGLQSAPAEPPVAALLAPGTQMEPAPAPFHIVEYYIPEESHTAYGSRSGSRIQLIVLHGDPGPARRSLELMTAPGARAMSHYYVAADATIYQLVDDAFAAWHAGMADVDGRQQNINRISIGVVIERSPNGYNERQIQALTWLIDTLRTRHNLPADAVMRWGDLNPTRAGDLADFPANLFAGTLRQ